VGSEYLGLFNMEYLSSVTAMVMAVNLITQIVKEIFLVNISDKRIPKIVTLVVSTFIVSMQHVNTFLFNPDNFHNSILELVFLTILNSFVVAGLSMGNYKVLGLTKERGVKEAEKLLIERRLKDDNDELN